MKKKYIEDSCDESVASDASEASSTHKKQKTLNDVKVFSNKTLDQKNIPPKPKGLGSVPLKKTNQKLFDFRLTFTNGILLRKFLEPASHAVKKMRFEICASEAFTGFKIECHDTAFTLADRGLFECDVDSNNDKSPHGISFCVNAEAFMEALVASTLKETDLKLTRYTANLDQITFESTNNENDVRTVYKCSLVDSSAVDSLDGITIELGFHVNVQMSTLKELSLNAKRCGAPTLQFELQQAMDPEEKDVVHSRMSIGFEGLNTSGSHDFFISTKKETKISSDGTSQVTWAPLATALGLEAIESLTMEKKCSNEYDNKKLRLFINHMECQYVLVHLCTDNTTQPLVLDCILGGLKTKHTVIVAPKEAACN